MTLLVRPHGLLYQRHRVLTRYGHRGVRYYVLRQWKEMGSWGDGQETARFDF